MGLEHVVKSMKRTLEKEGFKDRVAIFDFNKLNDPRLSSIAMMSFGRMGRDEIMKYGTTFVRTWNIQVGLYHALQDESGEEAHLAMVQDIDRLIDALEKNYHLGEGATSDIQKVTVASFDTPQVVETEEEVHNFLRCQAIVEVEETETVTGGE